MTATPVSDIAEGGELDPDERVGSVLADRYRVDALLGEGGMGKVYRAEHVLMKKRLAVKVLHRELTSVPEVVARFEREAMAAANIEHPNIAAATDFGRLADGSFFLVLEFVQGANLRDEISKGPMPPARAAHIVRQIASALDAAHALSIVHRDLKPENVMLIDKGGDPDFVKVLDFGVARVPIGDTALGSSGNPITKVGMVFGTPEYMAPEQALGQAVDGRADLYALGTIFYELLAGLRPFSSKSTVGILGQQLSKDPPPITERAPGTVVPPRVDAVVRKLLAREPSERFQHAADVVEVINQMLGPAPARLSTGGVDAPEPVLRSIPDLEPPPESMTVSSPSLAEISFPQPSLRQPPSPLARLHAWADAQRARLPAQIRQPLGSVPTPALLWGSLAAGLVLVLVFVLVLGSIALRPRAVVASASAPTSAEPPPSASGPPIQPAEPALAQEIAIAKKSGSTALADLASARGDDPRILIELAEAYLAEKKYSDAAGAVERMLKRSTEVSRDTRVKNVLHAAAQMPESTDAAFTLLDGPMGERGADVMYSLVVNKRVFAATRTRAELWLAKNHEKKASKAVSVTFQLWRAKSCGERRALLPEVEIHGDTRALTLLREIDEQGVNECLRTDDALKKSITAIEKRYPR
jgi:serine/threonine-protein kinase